MPTADELYLLSQKCDDLGDNVIEQWQKYFEWLEEVVLTSKQSRGEMIIPKTPARKKRVKKNEDKENNLPPPPAPPLAECVRKSSRAASQVAKEKNKTLLDESNINAKIRRPSTPPKVKIQVPESISDDENEESDKEISEAVEKENCEQVSDGEIADIDSRIAEEKTENIQLEVKNKKKLSTLNESSSNESDESGIDIHYMLPPPVDVPKVDEVYQKEVKLEAETAPSPKISKPTRVTRTKKRVVEEAEQDVTPIRSTRSKKPKLIDSENEEAVELAKINNKNKIDILNLKVVLERNEHIQSPPTAKEANGPNRITRSKVRPRTPKMTSPAKHRDSPKHFTPKNNQGTRTPKNKLNSPSISNTYSGSPKKENFQNKMNNGQNPSKFAEVHEVSVESIKVSSSPGKVVKHKWNQNNVTESTKVVRSKTSYHTPSPASSSAIKILGLKNVYGSVGLQSAYSQKRKPFLSSSSPQIIGSKVIGTPTEVNRTKNILSGSSFLTKVQPSKPSKEETEFKKQEEMQKKRGREEETRRKKKELLQAKQEEQKRKNDERMRRVQETRELREKQAAEERLKQEREKRQREDRIKEEKKKKLLEARRNEELKQQLRKQAEEEQRLKEERRIREEQRLKEEQRLLEELKAKEELKKIEERRKQEERKLLEKREAERLAKEKLEQARRAQEAERIAREKQELELLRLKETERLQSEKNLNETYTSEANPMNSTYSKPASGNTDVQSYEMTPVLVKKGASKSKDPNDYDIKELRSDDSTDDETAPKKKIPGWAQGSQLRKHLFDQEHFPPKLDVIFPHEILLLMPDLDRIFPKKRRSRFHKRTSSAVWNTPPCKLFAKQ